jgi:hypothetical protein
MLDLCRARRMLDLCRARRMLDLCRARHMLDLCRARRMLDLCRARHMLDLCPVETLTLNRKPGLIPKASVVVVVVVVYSLDLRVYRRRWAYTCARLQGGLRRTGRRR